MSTKSVFSKKKRNMIVFSLIILFFLLVALQAGDSYYNKFSDFLASKTNNIIVLPKVKETPFRLGLDLQGGAQLVYQADVSQIPDIDKDDLLDGVRDVIERRIDAFGVSEPVIQVNKTFDGDYQVIVELAGVKSVEDAIKEIGETPRLEFKEEDRDVSNISEDNLKLMEEYNEGLKEKINKIYQELLEGANFADLAKENNSPKNLDFSPDSLGVENDGDLGWISQDEVELFSLVKEIGPGQFSEVLENNREFTILKVEEQRESLDNNEITGGQEYKIRQIVLEKITLEDLAAFSDNWKNTELSGKNLKKAVVQFNPNSNMPEVSLEFDDEGARLFEEVTARNIGHTVAIFLDDYPISVPRVNEKISGGKAVISGNFSISEAKELVQRLKAGALPVPINLINQKTVGASLGKQSIADSLKAGVIGLILVALFMIIIYRLLGLASVFSLLIYGATVLAIFKALPMALALIIALFFVALMLSSFEELKILDALISLLFVIIGIILFVYGLNSVTLTLAGLAGFILSIGMAVDVNVLIFERVKEEVRGGRSLKDAIDEGIKRAWPSIRDGNVSTLLVCLVLMSFGTSVLKGFGTTLFIGVSVSMFSAIIITRSFLHFFLGSKVKNTRLFLGVKNKIKEELK